MDTLPFRCAPRILNSPLAGVERRLLVWLAERMPRAINSDHLTVLALGGMAVSAAGYGLARLDARWLIAAVAGLAINWFGDSLDGTLARVRDQQRPRYGFYVDHLVDALGALLLLGGLGVSGFMSPLVACVLLAAYYLVSIEVYLATYTLGTFRITFAGVGPTELRILLAAGTWALSMHPTMELFGRRVLVFDFAGVLGAAGLGVAALSAGAAHVKALYRAEPVVRVPSPDDPRRR